MSFYKLVNNKFKFNLFLFSKLPSAFFSGVRVVSISEKEAVTKVPYKWFSQNPFRSTYFACLAMAAELSTGILALAHTHESKPAMSTLVRHLKADYEKKATGITYFTCKDGEAFGQAVRKAITSGEAQVVEAKSEGRNKAGELVASFTITWSFKAKSPKI